MGKFDSIKKFLGNEDQYSPEQIDKGLDTLDVQENEISNIDLSNVDDLLKNFNISDSGQNLPEEKNLPEKNIEQKSEEETFAKFEPITSVEQSKEEGKQVEFSPEDLANIEEDVLKELSNLDLPAPDVSELSKKYETPASEEVEELIAQYKEEEEEKKPEEKEFEIEYTIQEEEKQKPFISEEMPVAEEIHEPEISDLLKQMVPVEEKEEEITLPEFKQKEEIPHEIEEVSELKDLFGEGKFELPEFPEEKEKEIITPEVSELEITKEEFVPEISELEVPKEEEKTFEMPSFEIPEVEAGTIPEQSFEIPTPTEQIEIPEEKEFELDIDKYSKEPEKEEYPPISEKEIKEPELQKKETIDTSDINLIREKINSIKNAKLRKTIRKILSDPITPEEITNKIISMLLENSPEYEIKSYIDQISPEEEILPTVKIEEKGGKKRKVIYTEDVERFEKYGKELRNISAIFGSALLLIIILAIILWRIMWIPLKAEKIYNEGLKYLQKNDFVMSEAKFKEARKLAGENLKWYNIYASNYIVKKEFNLAKDKYVKALEYKPFDKTTIYNFANFYKIIYPPRFDEAIKLLQRLLKLNPNKFEYVDKVGTTYIEWGDFVSDITNKFIHYNEANEVYEKYRFKHDKHLPTYFRLLEIALKMKNDKRIDMVFDTIDKINKKAINIKIMTELAKYYIDLRKLNRAKLVFDKLMPNNPQYDETHYEYARYLTINYDFLKAIRSLSNALLLNDKNGKAYNLLGEIYYIITSIPNNQLLAAKQFENAINFSPYYYKPYANLGHIYFYNNLKYFEDINESSIYDKESENNLRKAFYNYMQAKLRINKNDKDFNLSYNLSWLYYRYQRYNEAFNELINIYIDEPYNPALSYFMGNIYFKMGKFHLAKVQYDKAIEYYQAIANKIAYVNPSLERHREVYTQLARSYNNRGTIFALYAIENKAKRTEYEKEALLDFYKAKDIANKVNMIYNLAEVNIKQILNKSIKGRTPILDEEIPKRTKLQKFLEEFKINLIKNL